MATTGRTLSSFRCVEGVRASSFPASSHAPSPPLPHTPFQESLWSHMARLGVTQHDSHSCGAGNHGVAGGAFPFPRAGTEHVGAVYEFDGNGREAVRDMDLVLLVGHRGAPDCVPPPLPAAQRRALAPAAALQEAEVVDAAQLRRFLDGGGGGGRAFATAWSDGGDGSCGARARARRRRHLQARAACVARRVC